MRQRTEETRRHAPALNWQVLGVVAATAILIVFVSWLIGPSLFGSVDTGTTRNVQATVTKPADCSNPEAREGVQFELSGDRRDGMLSGCGHDKGEQVQVAVPANAGSGTIEVHLASTELGMSDLRRPVGLVLLVLSCAGGATYAFLVARGPKRGSAVVSV